MSTTENLTRARMPARICPPCSGDCQQGRDCPEREVRPIRGAGLALVLAVALVVAVGGLVVFL